MKEVSLEQRLSIAQNEYFELLLDIVNNNENIITEDKPYSYHWEQLKEKQLSVIHLADLKRWVALEKAKKALEEAFTPHLQELLNVSK
jgi:hypothetical protein